METSSLRTRLKSSIIILSFSSAIAAAAIPGAWAAPTASEIREAIEETLIQRHPRDNREWWRALGEGAPVVMMEMIGSTKNVYHRMRLTEGLAFFPENSEAVAFLKRQALESPNDVLRNASIQAVARSQGAAEVDFVADFLKHKDPQTRLAAARALAKIDSPSARAAVEGFLAREKTPGFAEKVRGERVVPLKSSELQPVASSEDAFREQFVGEWTGFWIYPKGAGLESEPAVLTIEALGPASARENLKGELLLSSRKPAALKLALDSAQGRGPKFSALVPREALLKALGGASKAATESKLPVEGERVPFVEGEELRLSVGKTGAWLMLRKR